MGGKAESIFDSLRGTSGCLVFHKNGISDLATGSDGNREARLSHLKHS